MFNKAELIKLIKENNLENYILKGNFGIEKENIRVDKKGNLSLKPHPEIFGNKLKNPYITVDFSESQIEMITPVCDSVESVYQFLENLHDIVSLELEDEYLWPQSLPAVLPEEKDIPLAKFDDTEEGKKAYKYRQHLSEKYSRKLQLISGIHYNFSFSDIFLEKLYESYKTNISFREFKDEIYLKIARNFLKYRWFLVYLIGASSPAHYSYRNECLEKMKKLTVDSYYFENTISFRNGVCGYRNKEEFYVPHNSMEEYIKAIENLIDVGKINSIKEFYSPIRLKAKNNNDLLNSLKKDGIEYLEIRTLDLNPFSKIGVELKDLKYLHLFIIFCFFEDGSKINEKFYKIYENNQTKAATCGKSEEIVFKKEDGTIVTVKSKNEKINNSLKNLFYELNLNYKEFDEIIKYQNQKLCDKENLYVNKLIKEIKKKNFITYHLKKAEKYLEESKNSSYLLKGYEDLELSTQILLREAIKRGIKFEILDRQENFILLDNGCKKEYIKQATKTSLDSYTTVLIMENKLVTKKVLNKEKIKVPIGEHYTEIQSAKKDYKKYNNIPIVVKPKSTNFGLGISIFKNSVSKEDFEKAVDIAFDEDNSILIEEFIEGNEYRFIIIGDEVAGILRRIPANVIGNGKDSIKKLVIEKNKNPLRGKGYKTPLEKIKLGEIEKMFLKNQNKDFDYIPQIGEIVYLRENSNISTGGDSIDYTDDISNIYKKIAIKAAKVVGAKICGVDMMLKDIKNKNSEGNYAIIELNFNPAIHIHCYPYKGKDSKLGVKVLNLLGF